MVEAHLLDNGNWCDGSLSNWLILVDCLVCYCGRCSEACNQVSSVGETALAS